MLSVQFVAQSLDQRLSIKLKQSLNQINQVYRNALGATNANINIQEQLHSYRRPIDKTIS